MGHLNLYFFANSHTISSISCFVLLCGDHFLGQGFDGCNHQDQCFLNLAIHCLIVLVLLLSIFLISANDLCLLIYCWISSILNSIIALQTYIIKQYIDNKQYYACLEGSYALFIISIGMKKCHPNCCNYYNIVQILNKHQLDSLVEKEQILLEI